jgi:hypothetical protein
VEDDFFSHPLGNLALEVVSEWNLRMLDASALENVHVDHASCAPDKFVQKPPCLGVQ